MLTIVGALIAVIWVVAPVVGISLIYAANQKTQFAPEKSAWVPVQEADGELLSDVELALQWSTQPDLVAPAWTGVVQSISIAPGDKVSSGKVIARVDGIARTAFNSPGVFYRNLALGNIGSDVGWLKALLSSKGYPQTTSQTVDTATVAGIRGFARSIGITDPLPAATFDPAWIVYLPQKSIILESVSITKAAPAPAAGTVIGTGESRLLGVALVQPGSTATLIDPADPGAPLSPADYLSLVKQSGVVASESQSPRYSGKELKVGKDRSRLDEKSARVIARSVIPSTASLPAQLVEKAPAGAFVVPAASISALNSLAVCVDRNGELREIDVAVSGAAPGGSIISGELEAGDKVRVPGPSGKNPCRYRSTN